MQNKVEIQSMIVQAQNVGIDLFRILSKQEYAFLSGAFTPNNNYARRLRFTIQQKLTKALQDGNALTNSVRAPETGSLTMLN